MYTYDNNGNKVQLTENYDDAQFSFKKPNTKQLIIYIIGALLVLFLLYLLFNQKRTGMAFSKQRYGFQFF